MEKYKSTDFKMKLPKLPKKWGERTPGKAEPAVEGPGNSDWEARNPKPQKGTVDAMKKPFQVPGAGLSKSAKKIGSLALGVGASARPAGERKAKMKSIMDKMKSRFQNRARRSVGRAMKSLPSGILTKLKTKKSETL